MILHFREEGNLRHLLEGHQYIGFVHGYSKDTISFKIFNLCEGETRSVPHHQRRKLAQLCAAIWKGKPYKYEEFGLERLQDVAHLALNRIIFLEFGYEADGAEFDLQTISFASI